MKKIFILYAACILVSLNLLSQSAWEIYEPPAEEDLVSVYFYDDTNGWIISETGTVLSTTDAGMTWNSHSFSQYHFESICFSDLNNGCIVGWHVEELDSSLILMTSDGGANWAEAAHPKVNRLNDVFFKNSDVGWAVGSHDELNLNCCLYTSDAGETWEKQMEVLVSGAELYGVHFRDEAVGVACGGSGAFLHTNSGGVTGWSFNISMPLVNLNAVWNMGSQHGCAVGDDGTVLYTINDWYQHIEQVSGTANDLNGVHAETITNKLWAVGDNGTIIHSPNYILGWITQNSGTEENLNDVCMLSETNGWAVGDNGILIRYSSGVGVMLAEEFQLHITPNPSTGIINLELDSKKMVERIEVIDILGQVSKIIIPLEASQQFTIDLTDLQNGIYFLKLFSNQESVLKRLILKS